MTVGGLPSYQPNWSRPAAGAGIAGGSTGTMVPVGGSGAANGTESTGITGKGTPGVENGGTAIQLRPGDGTNRGNVPGSRPAAPETDKSKRPAEAKSKECKTCDSRTYQDGSTDPGVSFKAPTRVAPELAAAAVAGHEQEHVSRAQLQAKQTGQRVVSQSVVLHNGICGECGRVYVAGGTTRTVTATKQAFDVGKPDANQAGQYVNRTV